MSSESLKLVLGARQRSMEWTPYVRNVRGRKRELVGANAFPDVLFTADRVKFAPLSTRARSLTKHVAEHVGLDTLIGLFAVPPEESLRRLEKVAGRPLVQIVQEWRTRLGN